MAINNNRFTGAGYKHRYINHNDNDRRKDKMKNNIEDNNEYDSLLIPIKLRSLTTSKRAEPVASINGNKKQLLLRNVKSDLALMLNEEKNNETSSKNVILNENSRQLLRTPTQKSSFQMLNNGQNINVNDNDCSLVKPSNNWRRPTNSLTNITKPNLRNKSTKLIGE